MLYIQTHGLVTYHFSNYKGLFSGNKEFKLEQFKLNFLKGYKGDVKKASIWSSLKKGKGKGILIGGNLSSLIKIIDTEFCPNFNNTILFVEELSYETNIEELEKMILKLKEKGIFNKILGLLIGNYETKEKIKMEDVF